MHLTKIGDVARLEFQMEWVVHPTCCQAHLVLREGNSLALRLRDNISGANTHAEIDSTHIQEGQETLVRPRNQVYQI